MLARSSVSDAFKFLLRVNDKKTAKKLFREMVANLILTGLKRGFEKC
jgi:hypothetical protein